VASTYYYNFRVLSTVRPSDVVNRIRPSQIDNTYRCSLFTAPKWGAFCRVTTTCCYYRRRTSVATVVLFQYR